MKRTTATLLTGALATGSALLLSVAAPGVASAGGCGETTLNESGTAKAWNGAGRFSTVAGETRATGHNEVVDGGLRVWTEGATSTDKAAALYPVPNLPLADQTAESAYDLDLTNLTDGGKPGYNLVLDINGPGNTAPGFVVLVKEEGFYGDLWHTSKLGNDVGTDGMYGVPEGSGYEGLGTIQQFSDANPDAVIQAFGYSLGSGVKGDVMITKIRFGCNDFVFDLTNRAPVADLRIDNGGDSDYRTYWLSGTRSSDPDGDNLTYTFTVDGVEIANPENKAEFLYTFPKGKKSYDVQLTVSDGEFTTTAAAQRVDVQPDLDTIGGPLANTGADVLGLAALGAVAVGGSATGLVLKNRRRRTSITEA